MPERGISDELIRAVRERYENRLLETVKRYPLPEHVGVIMDGNRRFAKEMKLTANDGHYLGKKKLEEFLEWCFEIGIRIVTVYAFSTENFKRDKEEVEFLMSLYEESFNDLIKDKRVNEKKIRVRLIGKTELLPPRVLEAARKAEEHTKNYNNYFLNVAIAYGGREEIIDAIKKVASDVRDGKITVEQIDHDLFKKYLYTGELKDPDLIIRTSGEERISNFLLWQSAYSELYFMDIYWPEMTKLDLLKAIRSFQERERRFGR